MIGQATFEKILEYYRFTLWIIENHPNLFTEYFQREPDPICPKCKGELIKVNPNPAYWLCMNCIKGYTNEELGVRKNAEIQ
jgi:hypothetical protein